MEEKHLIGKGKHIIKVVDQSLINLEERLKDRRIKIVYDSYS